jgi:hypothetical protein
MGKRGRSLKEALKLKMEEKLFLLKLSEKRHLRLLLSDPISIEFY